MKTKVQSKYVYNLSPTEYDECRRLNFRDNGCMQSDIMHHRSLRKNSKARVIVIRAEDGEIAAWALLQPRKANQPSKGYLVYFYTRQKYRRQGFASRLMKHVQRFDAKPEVVPHDSRSGQFFKNYRREIKCESNQRTWLRAG